jgi:hypothetical protein
LHRLGSPGRIIRREKSRRRGRPEKCRSQEISEKQSWQGSSRIRFSGVK